jgi:hypothetical protein
MSKWMQNLLRSKRAMRRHLSSLPFSTKLMMLEALRERSQAIAANPLRRRQPHKA